MFIPIEFQKSFKKTSQPAFTVNAQYCDAPSVMQSVFGGVPYWEAGNEALWDKRFSDMALLAQINFADIPENAELPKQGILQVFIPKDDELYGAQLDEVGATGKLRVQFWPQPCADNATVVKTTEHEDDLVPVFGAHVLTFSSKQDVAGIETIECAESLEKNPFEVLEDVALNEKEETLFFEAINTYVSGEGHKLLGYPSFVDGDPRQNSDYRLLLQIDSDMSGDNDIMWGENGIGQIFICKDDLQRGDFSNVWLYWDC